MNKDKLFQYGYRVRRHAGKFDALTLSGVAIEDACPTEEAAWLRCLNDRNAAPKDRADPFMRKV